MLEGFVLWKPLYYASIGMFILALVLLPFNSILSLIVIFALVSLWSRIPGGILYIFYSLELTDFFAFVIAANIGGLAGGLFGAITLLFSKIFFPDEEFYVPLYHSFAILVSALLVPLIITFVGGINIVSFFIYEGIIFFIYFVLVILFSREGLGYEISELPFDIFFNFFVSGGLLTALGAVLSNLMTKGITSGWPLFILAGVILLFFILAKSGKWLSKLKIFKIKQKSEE